MENKSLWKKPTALVVVAVLMLMTIPMMVLDAEAAPEVEVEEYVFYVDLTADCVQNGEWITGVGINSAEAFVDATTKAYGEEKNSVANGWISKINNVVDVGTYGGAGYQTFSQYGYVGSEWTTNSYLGDGTGEFGNVPSTNNHYAIFFTEHIAVETGTYVDESGVADEAAVLAAAAYPAEGKVVPENYTAVAMTAALDADEVNTWNVTWYIMPNDRLDSEDEYVDGGWGAAQRDDAAGLSNPDMHVLTAEDRPMSSSREVKFTYKSTESVIEGYCVTLLYDVTQLEFVSIQNLCDLSFTPNPTQLGKVFIASAAAVGVDGNDGLFSITFRVLDDVEYPEAVRVSSRITSASFDNIEHGGPFIPAYASVMLVAPGEIAKPSAGDEVEVSATSDDNRFVEVEYDTSVLRYLSVTNAVAVVNDGGNLLIRTASPEADVSISFVVVDNPLVGLTNVTANGDVTTFDIVASTFVIAPAVEDGSTTVSLYKVPAIAGFKMVFSCEGNPIVTDLAGLSSMGSYTTDFNDVENTLTIVWASPANVDLNGDLFSVSGVTELTMTADNAELRSVVDDLSSVRVNVDIAASLQEAAGSDPMVSTDITGDGETDLADLIALMQYLADYDVDIIVANADYYVDGVIDIRDAMVLQELIATA